MIVVALLRIGVFFASVALGVLGERILRPADPQFEVSPRLSTLLRGLAFGGPWVLVDAGYIPTVPILGSSTTVVVVVVVSSLLVTWLVGTGTAGRCEPVAAG